MTKNRFAQLAAVAALSTLALTACNSPAATTTSSSSKTTSSSNSQTAAGGSLACPSGSLAGEGSSAQNTAVTEVVNMYNAKCNKGAKIEYNPSGSGAGIKSFNNGLVDWAGSDSALKSKAGADGTIESDKAKERCKADAWNLPMVVGPVAIAYNLDGVQNLTLTPEVIAKIFYGQITKWDDEAIKKLNANAKLPSANITVFYRSDDSGTSENVAKYLKAAAKDAWPDAPAKRWTGKAGEGKQKSSGVAEAVKQTKNSLTYVEWSYATDNKLGIAQIDNGKGAVKLEAATVAKAVEGAKVVGTGNDLKLELKYSDTEAGAYPILLVTYEIVCSSGLDSGKTALLKDFLGFFASKETQDKLVSFGYAPLPDSYQTKVQDAIKAIK